MSRLKRIFSAALLTLAVTVVAGTAAAETLIDEIVVTAQKREQSLRDVPISVSVVTGEKILEQGFNDLEEITSFTPGVIVQQGDTRFSTVRIRGIDSGGDNVAFEQAVAVFNDGIYYGRSLQSTAGIYDIAQMEVLYGPQPVYFGQSAIAGLIGYSSRRPADEFEGYVVAEAGSDAYQKLEGAASVPLSGNWAMRIAGKYTETDGWTEVFATGEDGNASEDTAYRFSVQGDVAENLSLYVKTERFEQNSGGAPSASVICDPTTAALPPPARGLVLCDNAEAAGLASYGYGYTVNKGGSVSAAPLNPAPVGPFDLTTLPFARNDALGIDIDGSNSLAQVEWAVSENILVSSLTGYSEYESLGIEDFDGTPYASLMFPNSEEFEMVSQEFRIQSDNDGSFDWMAGLYFQEQELTFSNDIISALPNPRGPSGTNATQYNEEAEYLGAFASVTYDLTDRITLDYGIRYTDVAKDAYLWEIDSFLTDAEGNRISNTGPMGRTTVAKGTQAFGYSGIIPVMAAGDRCLGDTPNGDDCAATILAQRGGAAILAGMGDTDLDLDEDDVNHQLSLTLDLNDAATLFIRYVDGFKAGGFSRGNISFQRVAKGRYDAEEASSVELGGRFTLLEGALRINATLYYTDYDNRQVAAWVVDPVTLVASQVFTNAAKSTVEGFEADLVYATEGGFGIFWNGALTLGEFDSYTNAACFNIEAALGACEVTTNSLDLSGTDFDGQPDWTTTIGVSQELNLTEALVLRLAADVSIFDDFDDTRPTAAKFEHRSQNGFSLVNLRAALSDAEGVWEVALYGRNVTDELYWFNQPGQNGIFGTASAAVSRPANYGVQLRYNF